MSQRLEYAFRLVHIKNIPHILDVGFVLPNSSLASRNYVPIGDSVVIAKRNAMRMVGKVDLTQYIPFYFGPRSPMLYVIQNGFNGVKRYHPSTLVYCIVRLSDICNGEMDCMFTDGHALSSITHYYPKEDLERIDTIINKDDVYVKYWYSEDDLDLKRRKEAELLVKDELPAKYICGFAVYDNKARSTLIEYGIDESMIAVRNSFYF